MSTHFFKKKQTDPCKRVVALPKNAAPAREANKLWMEIGFSITAELVLGSRIDTWKNRKTIMARISAATIR